MENIITIIALVIIAVICVGILAWLEIKQAARNMAAYDLRIKAWGEEQARNQALLDERDRRRMLHEADSYNEAASMEPFCGEGKKP